MTDELSAVSVGLSIGLGSLDRDIAKIEKLVARVAGDHVINFSVGKVNTAEVQAQLKKLTQNALPIMLNVTVARGSAAVLRRDLLAQLRSGGPIPVQIKANLSVTEVHRIRSEISKGLGLVSVNVKPGGGGVAGAGGTPSTSGPITSHERRVNDDAATKMGRAVRSGSAQPSVAHAAPTPPSPASAPAAPAPVAQRASTGRIARTVAPAIAPSPARRAGAFNVPTAQPVGDLDVSRPTSGSLASRFRRQAEKALGRRVSPDELKAQSRRVAQPETPEEQEYAARPTQVSYHGKRDEMEFQQEKRGRGVRGASHSGARERNEPVLLPSDITARDIQHDDAETENAAERNTAVRAPARKSNAYFGGTHQQEGSPLHSIVGRLQFYRFAPELGEAFKHVEAGNTEQAREALRGFSARLSTADPRERKKFFRLFRNVENVPPELLEKHAAVQGLFAQINQQDADRRLSNTEAALKGIDRKADPDKYAEALGARQAAKKFQEDVLRGLKRRAGGGPVSGSGRVRLYRGDTRSEGAHPAPDWVRETQQYRDTKNATGRWFTHSPEIAQEYVDRFGTGGESKVSSVTVGRRQLEKFRVSNMSMEGLPFEERLRHPRRFSADPENEWFLPREVADRAKTLKRRAGGGPVSGGGLMARIAQQKMKDAYLVGEHKPETYVDKHGNAEVVGEKGPEIRTFPEDGKIEPFVPEWVRRGLAKDMTRRAAGGPVRGVGGSRFRAFVPGEKEAVAGGLLGRADSGSVRRVFVVNFPSGGGLGSFASQPRGAGIAAGPLRFGSDKDASKFAQELGGHIGAQMKDLLGNTAPVEPSPRTPKETPLPPPGAFERQEARRASRGAAAGIDASISASRAATSEAQQLIPVRSLSVAVGQIFSTIFGGRGDAVTRAKQANELAAKATSASSNFKSEQQKLLQVTGQLRKAENPKAQTELIEKVKDQAKATRLARNEAEGLAAQAKAASGAVIGAAGAFQNLAAGTVGVVAGTIGFGAALGLAQAGITGLTTVAQPAIERLTGYKNETAATTKAIADQIRTNDGAVKSTVALAAAQAGLSDRAAATINPLIEQRAAVEAGNTALADGLKLVHSAIEIRRSNAATGGADRGITSTTGGFFGSILGGVPSTQEQVVKELGGALPTSQDFATNKAATDSLKQNAPRSLQDVIQNAVPISGGGVGLPVPGGIPSFQQGQSAIADEFTKKLADSNVYIETFQGALDKAGKNFVLDQQKVGESTDQLAKRQTDAAAAARAFGDAGLLDTADLIRRTNLVVRGANGDAIKTADQARQFYLDINKSFTTPDVGLLLKQLTERIIPAQKALFRAEGNLQRNVTIPGQTALGEIASPSAGLRGGPSFESGIVGTDPLTGKLDKAAAATAAKYKSLVGGAVSYVNDQIDKGREALINLVPADVRQEFTGLLSDIAKTGQLISKIQTGITQQQVNLDVAEYNNQLRIARRSLADAKDLQAGIAGATKDTLGGIEGQNVALNRQLQLLQFELQQRQINFKVATAGFVAPGTTPEERAARIEEAKKEAEFAQKQLDIQKQLAANQFKGIQITASRDVTDLVAQISLLEQGRSVTINTAAAQRALDILNKKQQTLVALAGTYIEEGAKITSAALQAASQVQQQTGKGFSYILSETAKAWGIFGQQAQAVLNALTGTAPASEPNKPSGSNNPYANGIVGDTLGPTQITVGEAAGEKVAVIRNPQLMPSSVLAGASGLGGGGGSPIAITVVVTGNHISDSLDEHSLAERIATKVEETLMRKTSLYGLRRL